MDARLSGAQAQLALQEESVRRSERERRAALDQVATLERSLQATESELRASQVGGSRGPRRGQGLSACAPAAAVSPTVCISVAVCLGAAPTKATASV